MPKFPKYYFYIFFALLICGSYLRLYNLENTLLWQDEAETAFYAGQISDFKMPNAYDENRDLFLYIGALIPITDTDLAAGLIDTAIYGYSEEDFAEDGALIKHPYGDILVTALSFFIFSPSTFSARFLFALMGVMSLLLTYKLAEYLYNAKVGLISMAFQTFNIVLVAYERQARYYSLAVFCFLGVLYFGLKAIEKDQTKDYFYATLFSIGLICGNPITAVASFVIIFAYTWYSRGALTWLINKKLLCSFLLLLVFVVTYSFIYQPWRSWHSTPVHFSFLSKFIKTTLFVVRFSMDSSFLPACLGIGILLYRRKKQDVFLLLVYLVSLAVYPLLIFYSSLFERLMLVIVPFLSITIAIFLDELYTFLQKKKINKFIQESFFSGVLLAGLMLPATFSFPANIIAESVESLQRDIPSKIPLAYYLRFINGLEKDNFLRRGTVDPQWVEEAIEFLKSKNVPTDEWVFTTFSNTAFLFYSDLKVQLIWPIRKSFLDSYSERFWILIGPYDSQWSSCQWFYKFADAEDRCRNRNYKEKIAGAKKHILSSGAIVYECNPFTESEHL